nr:hypothetical protein [uncultured Roseateles sp.]
MPLRAQPRSPALASHRLARLVSASALTLGLALGQASAVQAQVNVGIGIQLPGVDIGINMPSYPRMVAVPGYPVYYAPGASSNYFFYEGQYWVFQNDDWYESTWYDGPWRQVGRDAVPVFVLRVPVRYYRQPPAYFRGWRADAPPRWGDHWGPDWSQQRRGWDQWNHRTPPRASPLPVYQRPYSGERYPRAAEQQEDIRSRHERAPRPAMDRPADPPRSQPGEPTRRGNARSEPELRPQPPRPQQAQPTAPDHGRDRDDRGNSQGRGRPNHEKDDKDGKGGRGN